MYLFNLLLCFTIVKTLKKFGCFCIRAHLSTLGPLSLASKANVASARWPPQGEKAETSAQLFLNDVSALLPSVPESPLNWIKAPFVTNWRGSTFLSHHPRLHPGPSPHGTPSATSIKYSLPITLYPSHDKKEHTQYQCTSLRCALKNGLLINCMLCIFYNLRKEKVRNRGLVLLRDAYNAAQTCQALGDLLPAEFSHSDVWPHLLLFASMYVFFSSSGCKPMAFPASMMCPYMAATPHRWPHPPSPARGNLTTLSPSSPRSHSLFLVPSSTNPTCKGGWAHDFSCCL